MGLDTIHWISSGLASFARGTNDAPKIVSMLLLGSATAAAWPSTSSQLAAFGGVALAMGLGSYFGGLRITEVLAEKITRMDHSEGLSANLTTSLLVLVSGTLGLPVSTTHISSSAIIGIGLLKGLNAVRWTTVCGMVLAWVVTLPVGSPRLYRLPHPHQISLAGCSSLLDRTGTMRSIRICRSHMTGVTLQGGSCRTRGQELANGRSNLVSDSSEYLSPLFGELCDGCRIVETPMDESNDS